MQRILWSATAAAILFLFTAPAQAQGIKDTLQNIPEEVLGFVVTNHLDQIDDKLHALAKKMNAPLPGAPLETLKTMAGISKGLNAKGSAGALFLAREGGDNPKPVAVFLIPVTDYQDFLGQFQAKEKEGVATINLPNGQAFLVAKKGSYAVLTGPTRLDFLQKVLTSTASVATWAQPIQSWLEENDVAVVVTPQGLKKGIAPMREGLAQAKPMFAKGDAQFMDRWLDGLDGLLKAMETEVTHAGLAARLDKVGNLNLNARALLAQGGKLAKGAAAVKAPEGGPLAGLPAGPYAMAFGGALPEKTMQELLNFNLEIIKTMSKGSGEEIPEAKAKKLQQTFSDMMKGMQGMGMVLRSGKEGEHMFSNVVATMQVDNAPAYLDRYEKIMPQMQELYNELKIPFGQNMEMKKKTIGQTTILEVTAKMIDEKISADPVQKKMMELMFGPGGKMTTSFAAANDTTLVMTYRPAESLKEVLQALAQKKGLVDDPQVASILSQMPAGAQWMLLVDPHGLIEWVKQMANTFAPGMPLPIPPQPQTPPIGLGAKVSGSGVTIHLVVPVEFLENIGKMIPQKGNPQ